jgi:preprotein translocase subunit SecG
MTITTSAVPAKPCFSAVKHVKRVVTFCLYVLKGMILMTTVISVIQLLACVVLIAVVLFQSGKTAGLSGAIGGGSETFLSKNKAKSVDAKLARATKWVAIVFVVLTLVLNMI